MSVNMEGIQNEFDIPDLTISLQNNNNVLANTDGGSGRRAQRNTNRRRSSFMPQRNKPTYETQMGELYKDVSENQTPEERITDLTRHCLHYTLQQMRGEIPESDFSETLHREVNEATVKVMVDMTKENIFKEACVRERFQPNPSNEQADAMIAYIKTKTDKILAETIRWDKLTQSCQAEADIVKGQLNDGILVDNLPAEVKHRALASQHGRVNFDDYMRNAQRGLDRAMIATAEIANTVTNMHRFEEQISRRVDKEEEKFIQSAFPKKTSPRSTIKQLMEYSE